MCRISEVNTKVFCRLRLGDEDRWAVVLVGTWLRDAMSARAGLIGSGEIDAGVRVEGEMFAFTVVQK